VCCVLFVVCFWLSAVLLYVALCASLRLGIGVWSVLSWEGVGKVVSNYLKRLA